MADYGNALQQAQNMLNKLTTMKLNKSPLPTPQKRVFPVSTLPNGQVLLSDGKTRQSFPSKRAEQIKQTSFNQMKPAGDIKQNINKINMEITTPAKKLALGGEGGQNYFVNLLDKVLQPKMKGAEGIGPLKVLLPGMQDKIQRFQPSAQGKLPELGADIKNVFGDKAGFYKKFMEDSSGIQEQLAKDFFAQYNQGEQPIINRALGKQGVPLTADYKSRFGLPATQNARYSQMATSVNDLNKRI